MSLHELIVGEDGDGMRLDRWIRRTVGNVPQARMESLLRRGRIRIDGKNVTAATRLIPSQRVLMPTLTPAPVRAVPAVPPEEARKLKAAILHSDADLIVLNKPPGLPVQGGTGTGYRHVDGLSTALTDGRGCKPHLVHRLDKDTSGLLLLARDPRTATRIAEGFRARTIRKLYWAIVDGVPDPAVGEISDTTALTRYRAVDLSPDAGLSWLALVPHTGRKHQLRRHMARIGHPVLGDVKYARGGRDASRPGLHLHARRLWLPAMADKAARCFEAPISPVMSETFAALGFDPARADADSWF